MDSQKGILVEPHPNKEFIAFVKKLSPVVHSKLKKKLRQIPGHNETQFKNWMTERARISPHIYRDVNELAKAALKDHITEVMPEMVDEEILLNLFKHQTMDEKTNIFLERAKRRWSQEELAKKAGVSSITIYNIENIKKTGKSTLLSTARKIANAFGLGIDDFEEFAQL